MALRPYKRWMARHPGELDVRLEAALDAAIAAMAERNAKLGVVDVDYWQMDQDNHTVSLELASGKKLTLRGQIIGSHDGNRWLWADENPSVDLALIADAKAARAWLTEQGYDAAAHAKLDIAPADGWALLGLAMQATDAQGAYVGHAGGTWVYVTLRAPAGAQAGWLKKLSERFSRRSYGAQDIFDQIRLALGSQVPPLPVDTHRHIQVLANGGVAALELGDADKARELFGEAWRSIPGHPFDQPCSGWLALARAEAELSADCADAAEHILEEALSSRAVGLDTTAATLRLAGLRRARGATKQAAAGLMAAWVAGGDAALKDATPDDLALLRSCRDELLKVRKADQGPEAVVKALQAALRDLNNYAYESSTALKQKRTDPHVMTTEEVAHLDLLNARYVDVLGTWCTPERSPRIGSWSNEARHDPERERTIDSVETADGVAIKTVHASEHGFESHYEYRLVRRDGRWWVDALDWVDPDGGERHPDL